MGVEALAQVELDRQGDLAGDHAPHHRQPQPQDARADDRQGQRQQVGLVAGLDRVDRAPDQPGDQHRHPHRRPGEGQRTPQLAPIGAQKPHQSPVGPHYSRLYKVKYWTHHPFRCALSVISGDKAHRNGLGRGGGGGAQSKAAALALGTLPPTHLGPWPGLGRIWKLVTAWKGVVEPSFSARLITRR